MSCAVASVLSLPLVTAEAATQSFAYTGGEQVFSVPAGVTSLHVVAIGAREPAR